MNRKLFFITLFQLLIANFLLSLAYSWDFIGGPSTKTLSQIVIDPTSVSIGYVGTKEGGIFKTTNLTNANPTWFSSSKGLSDFNITCLLIEPQSKNILYAGTQSQGIFKSTNSGASWLKTPMNVEGKITAIVSDPTTIGVIYAIEGTNLHLSMNGGNSWTKKTTGLPTLLSIAINNTDSKKVYVGTNGKGIYKSTNRGDTWQKIFPFDEIVSAIATPPIPSDIVVAGTSTGLFYISRNGGDTWNPPMLIANYNNKINHITFDLADTNKIYVALNSTNNPVYQSTDCGKTWSSLQASSIADSVRFITPPRNSNIYAIAFSNGLYRTPLSTINWTKVDNKISYMQIKSVLIKYGNQFYIGTNSAGIYKKYAESPITAWESLNDGLYSSEVMDMVSYENATNIFSAVKDIGIFKYDGTKWSLKNTGLTSTNISELLLRDGDSEPKYLYVGTYDNGVFESTDKGETWVNIGPPNEKVISLSLHSNSFTLYFITEKNSLFTLFKGVKTGTSWRWESKIITLPGIQSTITNIKVSPIDVNMLYLGTSGNGMYISENGGDNWQQANLTRYPSNLYKDGIANITFSPNNPNIIYIATNVDGVFRSSNRAFSWEKIGGSFSPTNVKINDISISKNYGYIIAGTEAGTFQTQDITDATPPSAPTGFTFTSTISSVTLKWNKNPDSDLQRYFLYRRTLNGNFALRDSIKATDTNYTDTNVITGTTYNYILTASDYSRNESLPSNMLTVTPRDTVKPSPPQIKSITNTGTGKKLIVEWTLPTTNVDGSKLNDLAGTVIYYSTVSGFYSDSIRIESKTVVKDTITNLTNDFRYYVSLKVFDTSNNFSRYSNEVSEIPTDITPPSTPDSLRASPLDSKAILYWRKNKDEDLAYYKLYRGKYPSQLSLIKTVADTYYIDDSVFNGITYYYSVSAVDSTGLESGLSDTASVIPLNLNPPSKPMNLKAYPFDRTVTIVWNRNPYKDQVSFYNVYSVTSFEHRISNIEYRMTKEYSIHSPQSTLKFIGSTADTTFTITGLNNDVRYYFAIEAVDIDSMKSPLSDIVSTTPYRFVVVSTSPKDNSNSYVLAGAFYPDIIVRFNQPVDTMSIIKGGFTASSKFLGTTIQGKITFANKDSIVIFHPSTRITELGDSVKCSISGKVSAKNSPESILKNDYKFSFSIKADTRAPVIVSESIFPQNGSFASPTTPIIVVIKDGESGVNPKSILLKIDDTAIDSVYKYYNTKTDSLIYNVKTPLYDGEHILTIDAKDNSGNSALQAKVTFKVTTKVLLESVVAYPNPFTTESTPYFYFKLSKNADVVVKIFTITGELVKTIEVKQMDMNKVGRGIYWDGKNESGNAVAPGAYIYHISADDGKTRDYEIGKCVKKK